MKMKRMKFLPGISLILMVLAFAACDNEPVDPVIKPEDFLIELDVVGTYKMTAYNTSIPTDLDKDGTTSINQMDETTCFSESYIIVNEDNTFSGTIKGIRIVSDGTTKTLDCIYGSDIIGTWEINDSTLILNYTVNNTPVALQCNVSGNKLIRKINNGEIVAMTSSQQPVYLSADIEIVYTKQD